MQKVNIFNITKGEIMVGFYNMPLRHKEYGEGAVKGWDGKTITVRFAHGDKRFWFPLVFDSGSLSTMNEKDEKLIQEMKSRWEAVYPPERAERYWTSYDITGEVIQLMDSEAGEAEITDAVKRLHDSWGHLYSESEIEALIADTEEELGKKGYKRNKLIVQNKLIAQAELRGQKISLFKSANPVKKMVLLVGLMLAILGAVFSFVSALVWSVSDVMQLMRAMFAEADGYLAMFIIFGIGGAIVTVGGVVCLFIRIPYQIRNLDIGLFISGSLLMVGGLVAP